MIITAGKYKGRKLKIPKTEVRPTSSKVRESIFNMINVEDMRMLDLFAGSGVMGLEALSRGAKEVICVEKSPDVVKILKQNLTITNSQKEITLIVGDALRVLDRLILNDRINLHEKSANKRGVLMDGEPINDLPYKNFDLIFIDPPYKSGLYEPILNKIKENKLLNDGGYIVVEHDCKIKIETDFEIYKSKKYGDTCITIYVF